MNYSLSLCHNNPYSYKDYAFSLLQTKQPSYLQSFFAGRVPCTSACSWYMSSGSRTKWNFFFSFCFQSYKQHLDLYISVLVPLSAAIWHFLIYVKIRNCQRQTEEPCSKLSVVLMVNLSFSQPVQFSSKLYFYSTTSFLCTLCPKCYCKIIWANSKS